MDFADVFKKYRKQIGYTQEEIANILMVTPQAVSRWETGAVYPDVSLLKPISRLFNVSIDELLGNTEEKYAEVNEYLMNMRDSDIDIREKYNDYLGMLKKFPHSNDILSRIINCSATILAKYKDEMTEEEIRNIIKRAENFSKRMRDSSDCRNDYTYSHAFLADVYMSAEMYTEAEEEISYLPYTRYGKARMMGNLRFREKKYKEALEYYRESISDSVAWLLWDIERSAQCIYSDTCDNTRPLEIFQLEYDLIHILYNNSLFPYPHSYNLMYVNMQLAANYARKGEFDKAFYHLNEIIEINREYLNNYGVNFNTGCVLYPKAKQPFDNPTKKARSYKSWILRCLEWKSFDSLKEDERYTQLKNQI